MNNISVRHGFDSNIAFGPTVAAKDIVSISPISDTLLIHGYHNTVTDGLDSYQVIQDNMKTYSTMTGFFWPGGLLAVAFPIDISRATEAGWRLRDILKSRKDESIALDIQTHSLGARVALEALKYGDVKIRNLILTAPAVSRECFSQGGEFSTVVTSGCCKTISVFHSGNDPVLKHDYPLGTFGQQALGLVGVGPFVEGISKNTELISYDCTNFVTSHSGYRTSPQFYTMWKKILFPDYGDFTKIL